MERILSLLPSTTEIAGALGLAHCLVGRSHECDLPHGVESLPVVTEPKLDIHAPSRAIDRRVKELVRDGLSVYRVDADRVRGLHPDVILTQTQCEVCAVTPGDLRDALDEWVGAAPELVAVEPNTLSDVLDDFARVGRGCGVPERGAALARREHERIEALSREAQGRGRRPRVACLEWIDPLMGCGNWLPELVERAGGESVTGAAGEHAEWTSLEELAALDPDTILIAPCGFDLTRGRRELAVLAGNDGWRALRAVEANQVFLVDGFLHMNRPGARIAESLELVAEILQPERFSFGWRGRGWEAAAKPG
jgi:iron complex transport system substrate-binding protein